MRDSTEDYYLSRVDVDGYDEETEADTMSDLLDTLQDSIREVERAIQGEKNVKLKVRP